MASHLIGRQNSRLKNSIFFTVQNPDSIKANSGDL